MVEPPMAMRQVTNAEGKRAIGQCAATLVPDGASVIISSGTTTQSVAEALTTRQPDGHLQRPMNRTAATATGW
jgi:DeoR/GlpR family transcriptional regulator of sugar metabolism